MPPGEKDAFIELLYLSAEATAEEASNDFSLEDHIGAVIQEVDSLEVQDVDSTWISYLDFVVDRYCGAFEPIYNGNPTLPIGYLSGICLSVDCFTYNELLCMEDSSLDTRAGVGMPSFVDLCKYVEDVRKQYESINEIRPNHIPMALLDPKSMVVFFRSGILIVDAEGSMINSIKRVHYREVLNYIALNWGPMNLEGALRCLIMLRSNTELQREGK